MATVKHSAYERCVNMLNDLTAAQDKVICAALARAQPSLRRSGTKLWP